MIKKYIGNPNKYYNMNELARILDELINTFGFGCEFSEAELYKQWKNANEIINRLIENDLIEKNQLSNKYYLTDIFTCNTFLSQYLIKNETPESERIKVEYERIIEKQELISFITQLDNYRSDIVKINIKSQKSNFKIKTELETTTNKIEEIEKLFTYPVQ